MKLFYKLTLAIAAIIAVGTIVLVFSFRRIYHPAPNQSKAYSAYRLTLNNFADFKAMQGSPLSDKFNDVLSVKLVYDIQDARLYFVNSSAYRYHSDFARLVLNNEEPLEVFNTLNYGNTLQRQYFLANINYYQQSHIYALEFSSEDEIAPDQIKTMFQLIQAKSYLKDSLRLLIGSDNFVKLDNAGRLDMRKVYSSDIYKGQKYQALNVGVTYGILRDAQTLGEGTNFPQDIVILKGTPVNVPVCAGIITNSFQTPLSHINILCHNRNIPSAVQTDIYDNEIVKKNLGKPVKLSVTKQGIEIMSVSSKTLDSFRKQHNTRPVVLLKFDTTVQHILLIKNFDLKKKDIIGNKAAGVGELYKVANNMGRRFDVPEGGFAIPFYFYKQHITVPAIRWKIDDLIKMQQANAKEQAIKDQLKLIRKAIKEQPLDPALLASVIQTMKANGDYKSYRFRSSANAEDVEGFSGAGLYESKTGKLNDADKPIDMAIKKVWASVYDDNAYFERASANIDEHTMMMGIMCHRNFPDETANGVAITKNLYRAHFPGFTVNVQVGEVPVVSPPDSVTCEQFICMKANEINPLNTDVVTDYITYSNINNNKPVLTHTQVKMLYYALSAVRVHYLNYVTKGEDIALDIEFKFDKNGKLYLKQARPYR